MLKKADIGVGLYLLAAVVFFIVPIPSVLLDVMLAFNISIALIIVFNVLFVREVLDMSFFPTLLLFTTIFRISLNVSSTRLILTTGGVSVGDKDLVPDVIESLNGRVLFHGIRVKPGMPTMLSVVEDIPVLSLSGNPFAVAALFELLAGGYLADRAEEVYIQKKETKVLRQTFVKTGKPKRIVKGKCDEEGVFLPQIQRNGQLKNGIGSNCLVVFPEGERTYPEGEKIQVIRI